MPPLHRHDLSTTATRHVTNVHTATSRGPLPGVHFFALSGIAPAPWLGTNLPGHQLGVRDCCGGRPQEDQCTKRVQGPVTCALRECTRPGHRAPTSVSAVTYQAVVDQACQTSRRFPLVG